MALPLLYNVRSLRVRWPLTSLGVLGVALVVAVCVVLMSMAEGFRTALRSSGRADNAVIVQRGSPSEQMSYVPLDQRNAILNDPLLSRAPDGEVLASWERVMVLSLPRKKDGRRTNVVLRAVPPRAFQVHADVVVTGGRLFTRGLAEVVVGRRIMQRVRALDPGATFRYRGQVLRVVGSFECNGAAFESEVWGDFDTLSSLLRLGPGSNTLVARMNDPAQVPDLDRWLRAQPGVELAAFSEHRYYEAQSGPVVTALETLAMGVALIMGVGAVFGAMNTMYAIVAARTREIGTLRALGFTRRAIVGSFVLESVLLALVGGVLGCLLASTFQGRAIAASNLQTLSEVAFAFRITPRIVLFGLSFAAVMGALGGLLPALRAARLSIAAALRAG